MWHCSKRKESAVKIFLIYHTIRYASNPTSSSYKDEAFAIHYNEHHPGLSPVLIFELLGTESNTVIRKVLEAHFIFNLKPEINNKEECSLLQRFLVQS